MAFLRIPPARGWAISACVMVWLAGAVGCSAPAGPPSIRVPAARYHEAFDAAVEAARRARLPAVRRDRRSGTIEAGPTVAGSLLEPWHTGGEPFGRVTENTLAHQRRRARFEFTPAGAAAAAAAPDPLTGPDLVAVDEPPIDLTDPSDPAVQGGDLDLTVRVYIERAHSPGIRRSTWTREATTRTLIITGPDGEALPATTWTPVGRDEAMERRLLGRVEKLLGDGDHE